MSAEITISNSEMMMAVMVAVMRRMRAMKKPGQEAYQEKTGSTKIHTSWDEEINGAIGELVLCKHFNICWDGSLESFKDADLPGGIDAKASHSGTSLILRPPDKEYADKTGIDKTFIHLYGYGLHWRIVGWMKGSEGMVDKFWDTNPQYGKPCWWIKSEHLHNIKELPHPFDRAA